MINGKPNFLQVVPNFNPANRFANVKGRRANQVQGPGRFRVQRNNPFHQLVAPRLPVVPQVAVNSQIVKPVQQIDMQKFPIAVSTVEPLAISTVVPDVALPQTPAPTTAEIQALVEKGELKSIRENLATKLNDIERVDKIVYDYDTILRDKIDGDFNKQQFENWMSGIAYFLGSEYYNHDLFFNHLNQNEFFSNNPEFKSAFGAFVTAIKKHSTPLHKSMQTADKVKNIAIMYPGTGGGGHKAPAMAMAKSLEQQGYKVTLLDSDEFERPYDPKIGGLTRGEIYTKIYQQEGNVQKAYQMWTEGNEKQAVGDRRYAKDLTNALKEMDADHLFVVAHHQPEHAALAYQLGLPATYVHTDNEFHCNLQDVALNQQELENPLVSFTSLSDNPEFFHHLLFREKQVDYNHLPENVKAQMVRMNFPVRESFQPVTQSEKVEIRRELGIKEDATVVKIAMGANGIPKDIKEMIARIQAEEQSIDKPMHVLVVCGNNADLKKELDEMNLSPNGESKVKFQILGFLNEKEMSQFDQSSDVWITKPGGSTSAEAQQMRKQMLYVPNDHHAWERTNARALEKQNLAQELNPAHSLVQQIMHRAKIGEEVEYLKAPQAAWSEQLAAIVHKTAAPILNLA